LPLWWRSTHEGSRKALDEACKPSHHRASPTATLSNTNAVEARRLEEIASQAEDAILYISINSYDAGSHTDPMILENLAAYVGEVYRGLAQARRLVTWERA
jgi:hypothetical protein